MARPFCPRHVGWMPPAVFFKPHGVPARALDSVVLTLDELEALRLADLKGLYQEQAAERMRISRPTFARIVASARRKAAEALVHGKALRLEGGPIATPVAPMGDVAGVPAGGQGHRWRGGRGRRGGHGWKAAAAAEGMGTPTPGVCVCASCGTTHPHVAGKPCLATVCPRCGARMSRKS